ncbi:hypothetical protein L1049_025378 [Liquidambar formosana]|uniref:S-protein homolog n=1 Tax=Liquidambar formosana TaxID=63359 RepID=A0AAP0R2J8_LIQFO
MDTLNCLSRVLLLVVVFSFGQRSQVSGIVLDRVYVHIINELGPYQKLTFNCKSADDDLGRHVLNYKDFYTWSFYVNFWDLTLFWCNFEWEMSKGKKIDGSFDIYDAQRDQDRCDNQCAWRIQRKGLLSFNSNKFSWERIYRWPIPDAELP